MASSRALPLCLVVLGCGREGAPNVEVPDDRVRASGDFSFTASALEVAPCRTVTLSWNVPDADLVNIEGGGVTLVATFDQRGTVESAPICEPTTFELTARGEDAMRVETITVAATWAEAKIDSFTVDYSVVVINERVLLQWSTRNAARIELKQNDTVVLEYEPTVAEVVSGVDRAPTFRQSLIDTATTTFVLTVSNPISTVSKQLQVRGVALSILHFWASPPGGFGRQQVELSWQAEGDRTELRVNGALVTDFPGTLDGTFELLVTAPSDIELAAWDDDLAAPARSFAIFKLPTEESEPNEDRFHFTGLSSPGAGAGSISTPLDVDFFATSGVPIRIWSAPRLGGACAFAHTLTIIDEYGTELGRVTGSPLLEEGVCGLIEPALHPFLEPLLGSAYIVTVAGDGVQTGDYLVFAETNSWCTLLDVCR